MDKADFSENDSKTQHTHNGTPLEEHSPSKDSSHDTDECLISNCNKNQETKVGSCASRSALGNIAPAVNDEVVPLTGSPYFTVIVRKSHVQFPFQLCVPAGFTRFLPSAPGIVILSHQDKNWKTKYQGKDVGRRLTGGWKDFVIENKLKIGDGCVFELIDVESQKFKVSILNGQTPPEFADSGDDQISSSFNMIK